MLSYRHAFHAGNFADVLKHIVLVHVLEHMRRKDKPFDYIDTHAGAGSYDLRSPYATKNAEHNNGIGKLDPASLPMLSSYFDSVAAANDGDHLTSYPGSPLIARYFLREQDRSWLFELHPRDHAALQSCMVAQRKTRVMREDGLKGLLGLLPPVSRRAVVLIDPSYEVKREFEQVFDCVKSAVTKFPTGVFVIWYPVVERARVQRFERRFSRSGIRNIQRFELGIAPDGEGEGMTSSGVIVINPPWTLHNAMRALLPLLADALAPDEPGPYRCDTLVSQNA